MGVFAMFRRKAKESDAVTSAEVEAVAASADEPEAEGGQGSDGASGPAAEATEAAGATEAAPEAEERPAGEEAQAAEAVESAAAEGVEIPKQQSAERAADSEAGEGARK
ncbi:hypothetical protein [Streptomyces beihaiensis]|uniref:Gliding motility protein n=1 Tax=Streptomyces beihaiensis TaxID=2984495 RepID=A0ABT3TWT5_9ACTN|nr:hypothetical protein [Streptomyces beihaiensis]MCX3060520.1 hypothetical protein [Streptomyces beihaiensis]